MNRKKMLGLFLIYTNLIYCQNSIICANKQFEAAEYYAYKNKHEIAINYYQKAFKMGFLANNESYGNAAKSALIAGNDKLAYSFFEKAVENGTTLNQLASDSLFMFFLSTSKGNKLKKSYSKLRINYLSNIDINSYAEIKKLIDIDQLIRTQEAEQWGISQLSANDQNKLFMQIDSGYIVNHLLTILNKEIPNAKGLGDLRKDFYIFFLHQMSEVNYKKLFPFIDKCIEKGILTYTQKALILDRYSLITKGYTIYGTRTVMNDSDELELQPIQDIKNIDNLRSKMGILPLSIFYSTYMPEAKLPKEYKNEIIIENFLNCNN